MFNLEAKNHTGKINKKLKKYKKSNFLTDLHLVCQDGTVSIHKILFLKKMQNFSQLLCNFCDHHSETFIILPDIATQDLEKEIKSLYSDGNISGLEELLWCDKKEQLEEISNKEDDANKEVDEPLEHVHQVSDIDNHNKQNVGAAYVFGDLVKNRDSKVFGDLVKNEESKIKEENELELENELKLHNFKIMPGSHGKSSNSPGILIVDNRFKYFYKSEWHGRFSYFCAENRVKKCQAKALVQRNDSTGNFDVLRCDPDQIHNHESSENKAHKIVKKMRKEMTEMILADQSLTVEDSLKEAMRKFSADTEAQLWEEVLSHWADPIKVRSFRDSLCRSKRRALGLTDSLVTHIKQIGVAL